MRIVAPYVKHIPNKDNIEHITKAARICYASQMSTVDDLTFIENLWKNKGHRSPFRHGTVYLEITSSFERLVNIFVNSAYCTCVFVKEEYTWFISTNLQFIKELDAKILKTIQNFFISEEYLNEVCKKHPEVKDIIRVSFEIQTQISTSRELNRVSPNNICEQSTRYCNFSKDKFDNHVAFCQPHWFDALTDINGNVHEYVDIYVNKEGKYVQKYNDEEEREYGNPTFSAIGFSGEEESQPAFLPMIDKWVASCYDAEEVYFRMLKEGMLPQDARGILPLDTATKLFYTYSVREWKHILDLRYKGTTGKPHPNAKLIAKKIYHRLKYLDLLYNYE